MKRRNQDAKGELIDTITNSPFPSILENVDDTLLAPRSQQSANKNTSGDNELLLQVSSKEKILCCGKRPDSLLENKIPTKREWKSRKRKSMKKNPILKASRYIECLNSRSGLTYKDIAEKFNISTARVCQTMALVRKLPNEIIDYLSTQSDPEKISYFTERRLRPPATLELPFGFCRPQSPIF